CRRVCSQIVNEVIEYGGFLLRLLTAALGGDRLAMRSVGWGKAVAVSDRIECCRPQTGLPLRVLSRRGKIAKASPHLKCPRTTESRSLQQKNCPTYYYETPNKADRK